MRRWCCILWNQGVDICNGGRVRVTTEWSRLRPIQNNAHPHFITITTWMPATADPCIDYMCATMSQKKWFHAPSIMVKTVLPTEYRILQSTGIHQRCVTSFLVHLGEDGTNTQGLHPDDCPPQTLGFRYVVKTGQDQPPLWLDKAAICVLCWNASSFIKNRRLKQSRIDFRALCTY